MIFRCGARVWNVTSNRTWSFPLPVQPCATATAPCSLATRTISWAIRGRPSAVASGILALVQGPGHQRGEGEEVDEQVADVLGDRLDRAGPQGLLADRLDVLPLAEVAGVGDHVEAVRLVDPLDGDRRVEPAAVSQYHLVACHGCSRSLE